MWQVTSKTDVPVSIAGQRLDPGATIVVDKRSLRAPDVAVWIKQGQLVAEPYVEPDQD